MLAQLSGILLPVFVLAGVGYGWRKLGVPFEREFVTRMVINVAGPCLVVDTLSQLTLPVADFLSMVAASTAMFVLAIVAAWLALRAAKAAVRSYLPAIGIGNTGNLGLPLCLFAFGQEGLALAVAVFVTSSVGQFTFTPLVQAQTRPWRTLATTPIFYGALIGVGLLFTGIELPQWTLSTLDLLGSLMIPLMLLALGNTLGELKVKRLKFSLGWGAARLALGFAVGHIVAWVFGLEGTAKGVLILQATMPAAVFNYLFAARYNRAPDDIAGIVLLSTLLSALTMPLLVAYVLSF